MEILVDLADGRVWLEGWQDFGSLLLSARTGRPGEVDDRATDGLAAALESSGAGWMNGDEAILPPGSLRSLAARAADEDGEVLDADWEDGFTAMLDYAGSSGWVDDDGAVRAHVEWRDA
jgi:hypothetical protein